MWNNVLIYANARPGSVLTLKPAGFITPVQALDHASAAERGSEVSAGEAC